MTGAASVTLINSSDIYCHWSSYLSTNNTNTS